MTYQLKIGEIDDLFSSAYGKVTLESERTTKEANIFQMPIPAQDSDETLIIDIFGVTKTITIKGELIATSTSGVNAFITSLQGAVNGEQTLSSYMSDAYGVEIYVYFTSVEWEYESGSPLTLKFTINLQEGNKSQHVIPP